ncbi:Transketolase central region [Kribbella flavida DSM 17836]|uniref:Transketolase central region n=1 Tax=Kribbella flavida (strain DSM 17836 / JCM 10339 / NBRC 14399) TaxID=479435 RepID=D2Q001_KRIFD|nr:thiamine pyrophosphate-dependent enzyme [Kribbella flavida]ADB29999.1 Transketolase central region [Kribbella flavida DSM 17836]
MSQVDALFAERVHALEPVHHDLSADLVSDLYDAQLGSRHVDLAARWLQSQGHGFYTIGSSGHEGNAAVAAALRPTDPALLHYRSGAFYLARAAQHGAAAAPADDAAGRRRGHRDGLRDILLGVAAAASEPIAGGRHKVFGRHDLAVIPQTSTIASHLPRAMGVAFSIARAGKLGVPSPWPADAVVVTSFGDASANHSTATGAINAALHASYQGIPMPLLLVCEDNGIGISVRTPDGWIKQAYGQRPGLRYFDADGTDLAATLAMATEAATFVRRNRRPAFLRLRTVRLLGHAGSDVETAYRTPAELLADEELDPLLGTARLLLAKGCSADEIVDRYEAKRAEVMAIAREVAGLPQLTSAEAVAAPLRLAEVAEHSLPERTIGHPEPLTLGQAINRALADVLAAYPESIVFGEDVGRKGGVYGVTRGLQKAFGPARVFDTLLDEQSILGLGLGAGVSGLLPLPEVQYLAYLHNAEDQLRGEAASLKFFSQGQYRNPMVLRIAGYGYQKGFGGHFHNDDAIGVLRDIPGIVIASPSRPDDAAAMLHTCAAAARGDGAVCVFLEPIALYHRRDLYAEGDDGWLAAYGAEHVPIGRGRTYGDGDRLTLVTFGNGVPMSLRVAARLPGVRVLDLRWLAPLPVEDLLREAEATGRVLVADETRRSGGVSEGVLAALVDAGFTGRMARVTSEDTFVPLGAAAHHVLLGEPAIEAAAQRLLAG